MTDRLAWGPLTIRLRLGSALAIALLPVLLLGAVQSVIAFRHDADERRASLIAGASNCASVNLPDPYFSTASAKPATVPGTPTPRPLDWDLPGAKLPASSRNTLASVSAPAISR